MTVQVRKWRGVAAGRTAWLVNSVWNWQKWRPRFLGNAILIGFRAELRARNLADSGQGKRAALLPPPQPPANTRFRTLDGTWNDLDPAKYRMGSVGTRFGRNRDLRFIGPESAERMLSPNPAEVSQQLMKRNGEMKPAQNLNLLAAAWIQFQVHDWFDHGPNDPEDPIPVPWPRESDRYGKCPMLIERTRRDPDRSGDSTPAPMFATAGTHWWDASQLYGVDPKKAAQLRSADGAGLLLDPPDAAVSGTAAENSWLGLEMMHRLFRLEHDRVAAELKKAYPEMSAEEIYQTSRLVVAALTAKIHTLEWTTAMLSHQTSVQGLRRIWWGLLATEKSHRWMRKRTRNAFLSGIPGSPRALHGVDYSITEEFIAVYRMHPLLPESISIRSLSGLGDPQIKKLAEVIVPHIGALMQAHSLPDLFYSLGTSNAGQITLNNYPSALRFFVPPVTAEHPDPRPPIDLAAVDILRVRERGVPRYNDFRRMMHLKPIKKFEQLGTDAATITAIKALYETVDDIDLLVGLYAEKCPDGFAFSETAFRMFLLMAERRLEADRFFTESYNSDTYTEVGFEWVQREDMRSVLINNLPGIESALKGVDNPFKPWIAQAPSVS